MNLQDEHGTITLFAWKEQHEWVMLGTSHKYTITTIKTVIDETYKSQVHSYIYSGTQEVKMDNQDFNTFEEAKQYCEDHERKTLKKYYEHLDSLAEEGLCPRCDSHISRYSECRACGYQEKKLKEK